jgi:hypothetical protein
MGLGSGERSENSFKGFSGDSTSEVNDQADSPTILIPLPRLELSYAIL